MHVAILLPLTGSLIFVEKITAARMNDQPQPEKIRGCLEASLKKDMKAMPTLTVLEQQKSKMFGTIEIKQKH